MQTNEDLGAVAERPAKPTRCYFQRATGQSVVTGGQQFRPRTTRPRFRPPLLIPRGVPCLAKRLADADWRSHVTQQAHRFEFVERLVTEHSTPWYEFEVTGWLLRVEGKHVVRVARR